MSIHPPERVWWKPVEREEKIWLVIAAVWMAITFFMMPILHVYGKQNPSSESYKIKTERYEALANDFTQKYRVMTDDGKPFEINGTPVVHPPAGGDAYVVAQAWSWWPILELEKARPTGCIFPPLISSTGSRYIR